MRPARLLPLDDWDNYESGCNWQEFDWDFAPYNSTLCCFSPRLPACKTSSLSFRWPTDDCGFFSTRKVLSIFSFILSGSYVWNKTETELAHCFVDIVLFPLHQHFVYGAFHRNCCFELRWVCAARFRKIFI